jgi:hypothetical protein
MLTFNTCMYKYYDDNYLILCYIFITCWLHCHVTSELIACVNIKWPKR